VSSERVAAGTLVRSAADDRGNGGVAASLRARAADAWTDDVVSVAGGRAAVARLARVLGCACCRDGFVEQPQADRRRVREVGRWLVLGHRCAGLRPSACRAPRFGLAVLPHAASGRARLPLLRGCAAASARSWSTMRRSYSRWPACSRWRADVSVIARRCSQSGRLRCSQTRAVLMVAFTAAIVGQAVCAYWVIHSSFVP
jgi:hypothetical protein